MSDPPVPAVPPDDDVPAAEPGLPGGELLGMSEGAAPGQPLTPSAARRLFGREMKRLREAVGLTLADAGKVLERSAATISRIENGKNWPPRVLDVAALLEHYASVRPEIVRTELKERILSFVDEGKKEQWFDSFKSAVTGDILPAHLLRLAAYESDVDEMRGYESDLVPGLLQTPEYARAVAQIFFPNRDQVEYGRFVEFRTARQEQLRATGEGRRLSFVVNETALRRVLGSSDIFRAQLERLVSVIRGQSGPFQLRVVPTSTAIPAAMNGPFYVMLLREGSDEKALVYLEWRSGAVYHTGVPEVNRFTGYFDNLLAVALPDRDAIDLIESIMSSLPGRSRSGQVGFH